MSDLVSQLSDLTTAIATEFKNDRADIGDLASLATTIKSSIVAAINEVVASVEAIAEGGGAAIDDDNVSTATVYSSSKTVAVANAAAAAIIADLATATTSTWSSQKISDMIAAAISDLVDGADGAMDTLKELGDAIAGDETAISAINTALANRVRVDTDQGLTGPQKAQAIANIGAVASAAVGNTDTDFVALFNAALS